MPYRQLSVRTRYPEFAEELLLAHGAIAVSFRDAQDDPVLEPAPGETPLWPQTETVALFPADVRLDAAIAALREALPEGAGLEPGTRTLDDQDWVRLWQKDHPPLKFGTRLWVCPREKAMHEPGCVTVLLDPGLAFGTGTHPSTALCLDWLAQADLAGRSVLDYGCGSGLLGIAAVKLGARHVVGVDLDPQALTATLANAGENGVRPQLEAVLPDAFRPAPFDVVLANILSNPLIELAPRLAACVRTGGDLVLAGLLERQADEVMSAYRRAFEFTAPVMKEGWVRLHGIRRTD
jgi:ribosomal protein L11 methyltransferase